MLAHALLGCVGLALGVAPSDSPDVSGVPVFDSATPGISITATPLDEYRAGVDRGAVAAYAGIAGAGLTVPPAAALLGFEDYSSVFSASGAPSLTPGRHALGVLNTLRFVGGGSSSVGGPVLYFDFFQNDDSPVSTFGVALPSSGTFIWTITVYSQSVVPVPTEGYVQVRGDAATSTTGSWALNATGPSLGANDPAFGSGGPGSYQNFDLDFESSVPACPPAGPPYMLNTYDVVGAANNTSWSWSLRANPADAWTPAVDGDVPGVAAPGTAFDVCVAFADSINDWAALQGCGSASLEAVAVPGSPAQLRIRTGGSTPFDLYVGAGATVPDTLVPIAPTTVVFNPTITRLALSGRDCNDNFRDDQIDIASGASLDANANGIPDECEAPPVCVGDLDLDGDTDVFDFGLFADAFGSSAGGAGYLAGADLDHDNDVDVLDFGLFSPDFGCGN